MMRFLSFASPSTGLRVREAQFIARSRVDVDVICEIANAVREQVAGHFGAQLEVWVHEPIAANPSLIAALIAEAEIFELDAGPQRAWLFIDSIAARRLVAAAFAETSAPVFAAWSPLEQQSLGRIMHDFARCCGPLVGAVRGVVASGDHHAPLAAKTMIAQRFGAPLDIEIDLLLFEDPPQLPGAPLAPTDLHELSINVRAIAGTVRTSFSELATLQIGAVLPMSKEGQAKLVIDHTTIAHGACGITGGKLAFRVGTANESQGV